MGLIHRLFSGVLAFLLIAWAVSAGQAREDPPLNEIRESLRRNLPETPDEFLLQALDVKELTEGLRQIDPYARLFSPDEYHSMPKQELSGIGAELFFKHGRAYLAPYQGGALARAGFMERVELTAVDGFSVQGAAPKTVTQRLQGKVGTKVELVLATLGENKSVQIQLRRDVFRPLSVELLQQEDQAVIRVREFRSGMTRTALRTTIDFIGPHIRPLFIDLRECTGGDIYEAFDSAALFLPEGAILGGLRLHGREEQLFPSPTGWKSPGPVVLIVGPDTASAAEAFATALRHHHLAILVGQATHGKCSTQTDVHLANGWVLRVTNGLVLGADGQSCDGKGLQPDILLEPGVFYDLPGLVKHGKAAVIPPSPTVMKAAHHPLHQLEQEGRLTVRALRAWGRLPTRYVRLALDLLAHDFDLLGADVEQVRIWATEATGRVDGPLSDHVEDLRALLQYMDQRLWDDS